MAYTPDWEPLADALRRVTAAGATEDQAKLDLCGAVADGKIRVRVRVAENDHARRGQTFYDGRGTGKRYEGSGYVRVPDRLAPTDFDWTQSRPLAPWPIGPRHGASREPEWVRGWENRPLDLIELSTAAVMKVLCGGKVAADNETVASPAATKIEKPRRGRPADYNWTGVKARLENYVSQNGPVKTLNELLQKCADFASELHPRDMTPSDKTIREAIKTHALDIAAGTVPGNSPGK